MRAKPGDHIVIELDGPRGHRREGVITGVGRADGCPPYTVRWLNDGHTTMLYPGWGARIIPAS